MKKKANYIGKNFGKLKVMECVVESDGINKGGVWLCKCSCGRLINVDGYNLHWRKSCGCLTRKASAKRGLEMRKPEQRLITSAYLIYKYLMKRTQMEVLSKEDWLSIVKQNCYYCNTPPNPVNGLLDEKSCCTSCEAMRKKLENDEDFYKKIRQITCSESYLSYLEKCED